MNFFKPIENDCPYLKMCAYGGPGSGKTYSTTSISIGLYKHLNLQKPICVISTETGISFADKIFKKYDIPAVVCPTSSFKTAFEAAKEAEKEGSILIIDSITNLWEDIQKAFKASKQYNKDKINLKEWGIIKQEWNKFTMFLMNSKIHVIELGRKNYSYEMIINDDGKKEVIQSASKMAAEKNTEHEMNITLEFEFSKEDNIHYCTVLKDRNMDKDTTLQGKTFEFKNDDKFAVPFISILPHINSLNLEKKDYKGIKQETNTKEIFKKENAVNFQKEEQERLIWIEEIEGFLNKNFPGQKNENKQAKIEIINYIYNTHSKEKLKTLSSEKLKEGFGKIKDLFKSEKSYLKFKKELEDDVQ
jgi:hypothetical protein